MSAAVIDNPILNSPFAEPTSYWKLDEKGISTGKILSGRRRSEFIVPFPPTRQKVQAQGTLQLEADHGRRQPNDHFDEIRRKVGARRALGLAGLRPLRDGWLLVGDLLVAVARGSGQELDATAPFPLH